MPQSKYFYYSIKTGRKQPEPLPRGPAAACNIKCERTNTTSNDGYAFYRIYFFYHKKPEKSIKIRPFGHKIYINKYVHFFLLKTQHTFPFFAGLMAVF